eukprot:3764962-Rhodomonas_salina.1
MRLTQTQHKKPKFQCNLYRQCGFLHSISGHIAQVRRSERARAAVLLQPQPSQQVAALLPARAGLDVQGGVCVAVCKLEVICELCAVRFVSCASESASE